MKTSISNRLFSLETPAEWTDNTTYIWSAPTNPAYSMTPNVVSIIETLPPGQPFHAFVNKQMKELSGTDKKFIKQHKHRELWNNRDSIHIIFHWNNNGVHIKQNQRYILYSATEIISLVFTAEFADYDNHIDLFEQIENSFCWQSDDNTTNHEPS